MFHFILHTDIISSLKSGDNPAGNGGSVDTSRRLNDLSNSTSSVVSVDRRLRDEEPEIFGKLAPDQYGPKGMRVFCTLCIHTYRVCIII